MIMGQEGVCPFVCASVVNCSFFVRYNTVKSVLSSCKVEQIRIKIKFSLKGIKVKCTLVQALGLCTGRTAHRGSRGIAVLFLDHGTRRG